MKAKKKPEAKNDERPTALYRVYGKVVGSKYLGTYRAASPEEAEQMALNECGVSLCHQCSSECEDPEIERCFVDEVEGT